MKAANMRAQLVAQIAGQIAGGQHARGDFDSQICVHHADEIVTYLEQKAFGEPIYHDRPWESHVAPPDEVISN